MSWTYNEPALWLEYTLDCARLAKSKGLYTNYVTNLIPGINDEPEELRALATWIRGELSCDVPWHITRNADEPVRNLMTGNHCPFCNFFVAGRFR